MLYVTTKFETLDIDSDDRSQSFSDGLGLKGGISH